MCDRIERSRGSASRVMMPVPVKRAAWVERAKVHARMQAPRRMCGGRRAIAAARGSLRATKTGGNRNVPAVRLRPPGSERYLDTKQKSARRHTGPKGSDSMTALRTDSWGAGRECPAPDRESGRHVICPLATLRDVEAGHFRLFVDAHAKKRLQGDGDDDRNDGRINAYDHDAA